jgi:hypothetical protein
MEADNLPRSAPTRTPELKPRRSGSAIMVLVVVEDVEEVKVIVADLLKTVAELTYVPLVER